MSRPIEFRFLSDVADFLRDTKKVEVTVDDLADALNAVSKDAPDLERKLARAMREAGKDAESLERALKDVGKAGDTAGDKMGDSISKGAKKAGDSAEKELGDGGRRAGESFMSNLGEGVGQGGGSVQDLIAGTLGDLVQDASGPVGAAVAAGAVLGTLVWQSFAAQKEAEKLATANVFEAFDEITGELDRRALLRTSFAELGGGELSQGLQDAARYAKATGLSMGEIADLITGEITPGTDEMRRNLQSQQESLEKQVTQQGYVTDENLAQLEAYKELLATTDLQRTALEGAVDGQKAWRDAVSETGANADQLLDTLNDSIAAAAEIGSGDVGLDELLDKAADLGWEMLTAEEQARIIGSNNPHVAKIKQQAEDVNTALANSKTTLENMPKSSLNWVRRDAFDVNEQIASARRQLDELANKKIPDKTFKIRPEVQALAGPLGAFVMKYLV